jgi:hypothetical protein
MRGQIGFLPKAVAKWQQKKQRELLLIPKVLIVLVGGAGFEPATSTV